jgi:hypothetical protein
MVALRYFLVDRERSSFTLNDFTISHWPTIIAMGSACEKAIADGEALDAAGDPPDLLFGMPTGVNHLAVLHRTAHS